MKHQIKVNLKVLHSKKQKMTENEGGGAITFSHIRELMIPSKVSGSSEFLTEVLK